MQEILGEIKVKSTVELAQKIQQQVRETDALLELDAYDTSHLLFEEVKNVFYLAGEIEEIDLDQELIDEILSHIGDLQFNINKAVKRKSKRLTESKIN